ncbi:MAG: hypothetical protein GY950_10510 [bacterium]|nr:hypothetical protein [bacterium]
MIVKVLCHFPIGELMFATENIQGGNTVYPEVYEPSLLHDGSGKIILTSPGPSASYSRGDTVTIAWETTGITGDVSIRIKEGSGSHIIEAAVPYNSSPYTYTFPEDLELDEYYFRVLQSSYYSNSSHFQVLPSGNWQNLIISISTLSRNIGEDKSYEISGISIQFSDIDRFFKNMMSASDRYIAGKKVELFTEDGQLIYTGTVEKWQFTEDTFELSINDKLSGLDVMIPQSITAGQYPNMSEASDGQAVPIIYGDVQSTTGAVKCWRVDEYTVTEGAEDVRKGIFLVAGHHCESLDAAFDKDGNSMEMTDFDEQVEGTFGQPDARVLLKYVGTGEFIPDNIRANVRGKMDTGSNLIQDPIAALKDIIDNYTGMEYNNVGLNAAKAIMVDRGYTIAAVIDKNQTLKDVLVDFCFSFDCDFYISKGNEIMITLLKWAELVPERSFIESQITGFQLQELPEDIRNKVQYMYKYNYAEGAFKKMPIYTKESSVANWGEFYDGNDSLNLTYVSDDDSAYDVVQRYVIQRKNPRRTANIDIPLSEFVGLDISDIIELQHPGAIDINSRKYQVRRVNIDFVADIVQVEAVDITSMTGGVFILGEPDLPAEWDLAVTDEARNYGYLADSGSGYFSNQIDYGKVLY